MKLAMDALVKFLVGTVMTGLIVFLPAGTLAYPGAWRLMALVFAPMLLLGVVLCVKAPALLEKRLRSREKEAVQSRIVACSAVMFVAAYVLAGLDFRFGWTHVPRWLVIAAAVVQFAAYGLYAEVMRENAFLSRTVEIQENQHVVDTGLYGVVRHPMYASTVLLYLAMPLVLGSWVAFVVLLHYPVIIALRIGNEEKVLREGLEGYAAYMERVRYRLIPFIW